ncbi:MAG: cytochrome c oxidase subunit II [Anaerolineales bacterium]
MSKRTRSALFFALLALGGASLAGCAGSPTFMLPNSSISAHEANLFNILIYMSIVVFVFVEGWLVFNIIRYRRRDGDRTPPEQVHGNNTLEIVWTVIPILLVAVLFVLTVQTVNAVSPPAASSEDINVGVVGHRWWWEYDYPDYGFVTANEMHVPVGATVQIDVDSVDVIHSFWVPQLSGKVDAIPGQTNHLWFVADQVGEFYGQCSEYCGLNHANMRIKLVVDTQSDFDAWVKNQQVPPPEPQGDLATTGHNLIVNGICSNCHALGETQDEDLVGPNLNHLFSRSVFAGATYPLTEDNIRRWLTQNDDMKPGNDMAVNLTQDDVDALMAYLTTLR